MGKQGRCSRAKRWRIKSVPNKTSPYQR